VPPALEFAPMVAADLPQVMEIERLSFATDPWTPGLFLHELKLDFSRLHLARTADAEHRLVGYACWWAVGDEVHILNLAVHPRARGCGAGRALVQHILDDAVAHHAASVSLEVRPENAGALALYRAMGFAAIGVRKHYYGRGEDAVIMERRLDAVSPPS
jgi:ribosomal-protein-alanine N-acetyltransferase